MKTPDFYKRGRWYRAFLECDGSKMKLTSADTDADFIISGRTIAMSSDDFVMTDYKVELHGTSGSTNQTNTCTRALTDDGCQGIYMPAFNSWDWAYIYVFAYEAASIVEDEDESPL